MSDDDFATGLNERCIGMKPIIELINNLTVIRRTRHFSEWSEFSADYHHDFQSEAVFRATTISVDFLAYRFSNLLFRFSFL
jgi:hypothetical protein